MSDSAHGFWSGAMVATIIYTAALLPGRCTESTPEIKQEVEEITVVDTVPQTYIAPVPKDSLIIRYDTIEIPVTRTIDSLVVYMDTISVSLPIEQKVYEDSTYKAYVSGFHPALDSISIFQRNITHYVYQTQTIAKTKRWGLGVQAGVGLSSNSVEPYIGVGVSYNIINW